MYQTPEPVRKPRPSWVLPLMIIGGIVALCSLIQLTRLQTAHSVCSSGLVAAFAYHQCQVVNTAWTVYLVGIFGGVSMLVAGIVGITRR